MNPLHTNTLARQLAEETARFALERRYHFLQDETKPEHIGEPFFLRGNNDLGVLLVHGLMAAPEEVREWAEHLNAQGFTVYAPRMAGHGTSALDLAERTAAEWMQSVERGRKILAGCCQKIVIAGFSTGGAVALNSVIVKPDAYAAVISISAPLRFKSIKASFAELVDALNHILMAIGLGRWQQSFVHNAADNPHINYLRCPVSSIVQIRQLMRAVRRGLPQIMIPALVMHADADPKVDVRGGREIYRRLGSASKHYREVAFHQHGIVRGDIGQEVFRSVESFLSGLK